jgi:hypothetical protein
MCEVRLERDGKHLKEILQFSLYNQTLRGRHYTVESAVVKFYTVY